MAFKFNPSFGQPGRLPSPQPFGQPGELPSPEDMRRRLQRQSQQSDMRRRMEQMQQFGPPGQSPRGARQGAGGLPGPPPGGIPGIPQGAPQAQPSGQPSSVPGGRYIGASGLPQPTPHQMPGTPQPGIPQPPRHGTPQPGIRQPDEAASGQGTTQADHYGAGAGSAAERTFEETGTNVPEPEEPEKDPMDQMFEDLIAKMEGRLPGQLGRIEQQGSRAGRRASEMVGSMGGGGVGGALAGAISRTQGDTQQNLINAQNAFEDRMSNLQVQWLDRKMGRLTAQEERDWKEEQALEQRAHEVLIESMRGESDIPQSEAAKLYSEGGARALISRADQGGRGNTSTPQTTEGFSDLPEDLQAELYTPQGQELR